MKEWTVTAWFCELAWLPPGRVARDVLLTVEDGIIQRVEESASPPADAHRLTGVVLPGMANVHSHAFHRALRGRTQAERGSFWTWRERMYAVAERLTPETYRALATAVYAEMALAGITAVGEFHYLHHGQGGTPYHDPNEMGEALVLAARDAGIRITLLDTCYLSGGVGAELSGPQLRFGDGDAGRWAERVEDLSTQDWAKQPTVNVGAAVHSVRAVPADQISTVAEWADKHSVPLHVHLSEQPAENAACVKAHGLTPTALLDREGALGARTVAIHATHLTDDDIATLGRTHTGAGFCPTTERDLADGIGPARALVDAGSPLSLGSDSHAIIDLFEEARAVELNARLATRVRGHFAAAELLDAATVNGHAALGWSGAGRLAAGALADFVAVRLDSPRTAGPPAELAAESVIFAANATDVTNVIVGGRSIVENGLHLAVGDVGRVLGETIGALL